MPFHYSVDKEHRLVLVIGSGRVTTSEVTACLERALRDPDFNADFDEFTDLREVTKVEIASYEVRTLAKRRLYSPKSRRAVLAPIPSVYGIARMWQAYTETSDDAVQFRVFYDLPNALKWIRREGLPHDG